MRAFPKALHGLTAYELYIIRVEWDEVDAKPLRL